MIFRYLEEQKIRLTDTREEREEYPQEEPEGLSIYVEELMRLEEEVSEDEQVLMHRVLEGDPEARMHLIEHFLPVIGELAAEYDGQDILPVEDLIQEGNLGLLTALDSLGEFDSIAACHAHLINSIQKAMQETIDNSRENRKMDEGIVNRVNHLNEAVQNLEQDLEHKVSAEELSAYLEMPLEEIRDILRMSGDQIELDGK
jgi:RNA polymerase primary sigma factor